MLKTLTLGCALAALTVSAASAAEPVRTAVVQYGDLNVASASGWKTLHQRLSLAAQQVCDEPDTGSRDQRVHQRARACRRAAIASAARAVSPQMASIDPRFAY
jgi:UrcA family protein